MRSFQTIDETMAFIMKKHRYISASQRGVHGYKYLRKPDGSRLLFEQIKGFRMFSYSVHNTNDLVIQTMAAGLHFKSNTRITTSSQMHLYKLSLINVYDHRAEFLSSAGIDFVYTENEHSAELQLFQEWLNNEPGILRARWSHQDDMAARILKSLEEPEINIDDANCRFIDF